MSAIKRLLGLFLSVIFLVFCLGMFLSVYLKLNGNAVVASLDGVSVKGSEFAIYLYGVSALAVIGINLIRLKMGLHFVGRKRGTPFKGLFLITFTVSLVGFWLAVEGYNWVGFGMVAASTFIYSCFENRVWKYFTEISLEDHNVYKKRLVIASSIICVMLVLGILSLDHRGNKSIFEAIITVIFNGYLLASIVVGWLTIRYKVTDISDRLPHGMTSDEIEKELKSSYMEGRGASLYFGSSRRKLLYFVSLGISSLIGFILIPFYAYVVATKKITV